jgi:hypothetical protein
MAPYVSSATNSMYNLQLNQLTAALLHTDRWRRPLYSNQSRINAGLLVVERTSIVAFRPVTPSALRDSVPRYKKKNLAV